jgi:chitodextrinase
MLSWNVTGASAVSIDNGVGDVSSKTSVSVSPSRTTIYKVTATNSTGTATAVATVTVNSAATDVQPPTTPTLVSGVAISATEVDLSWTASADNVGVAGYEIVRNGSVLRSVLGSALSYADTSVTANTSYTYSIKAYDAAGNYSSASNARAVTTPLSSGSTSCPGPATNGFSGCYFNNINLIGNAVFNRVDNQINFDWLYTTPDKSVTSDGFSVRWQGNFQFDQGDYTFTAITSDGMRIYIDGEIVLDRWRDQPAYMYLVRRSLTQGTHLIEVEYYGRTGGATAHLAWQKGSSVGQPPVISFFKGPSAITAGQTAMLSWNVTGANSISIDNGVGDVSGKTSVSVSPSGTTTYKLTAANSTGTATAVATVAVNSAATDIQPPTTPTLISAVAISAGESDLSWTASADNIGVAGYQIVRNGSAVKSVSGSLLSYADTSVTANTSYTYSIKAYDAAGNYSNASNARAVTTPSSSGSTSCPGPATNVFSGCYYNNINLTGNAVFNRSDSQINFDWIYTTPDKSVTANGYSVRWQGNFQFDRGDYTFTAITSDGMRIYIDGNIVLDRWRDQPAYIYRVRRSLTQGTHLVVVEYYERTGSATAHLSWQKN